MIWVRYKQMSRRGWGKRVHNHGHTITEEAESEPQADDCEIKGWIRNEQNALRFVQGGSRGFSKLKLRTCPPLPPAQCATSHYVGSGRECTRVLPEKGACIRKLINNDAFSNWVLASFQQEPVQAPVFVGTPWPKCSFWGRVLGFS